MKNILKLILFAFLMTSAVTAQSGDRDKGVELYNAGNFGNAAKYLELAVKNERDIVAFYYLGLTREKSGLSKDAPKAYAKAIENCLKLLEKPITGVVLMPETGKDSLKRYVQRIYPNELDAAMKSVEKLEALNAANSALKDAESKIMTLKFVTSKPDLQPTEPADASNKQNIKITKNPHPAYSGTAIANRIGGAIRLWVVFLPNGKIGLAVPINNLPDGLTEASVNAAKGIKFEPALENGKPVTVVKQIEYGFWTGR